MHTHAHTYAHTSAHIYTHIPQMLKKTKLLSRAGEIAQQLRALTVLAEVLNSVPKNHLRLTTD